VVSRAGVDAVEERYHLLMPGIESRFLRRTACRLITVPTESCHTILLHSCAVEVRELKKAAFWLAFNITFGSLNFRPRSKRSFSS
jgi:hypothetical protein